MNTRIKRKSAFNYFGGKARYLDWLLPLFPDASTYDHYVEPCCGSGAALLNKLPSPVETINDKDKRVFNFFRVLREHPDKLIEQLSLTAYSRNEFDFALDVAPEPIEDARRFFVRVMMSYNGGSTGENITRTKSWRIRKHGDRRGCRVGMSLEAAKFMSKIDGLKDIVDRLRSVQIENHDAFYIIEKFDTPRTFFYQDPPYPPEIRESDNDYNHEMTRKDHIRLSKLNHECNGQIAISSYNSELYRDLYSDWYLTPAPPRITNLGRSRDPKKREMLWTNYNPKPMIRTLF